MKYWLLKTEPNCYSWSDMQKDKTEPWDGVRNYLARNYMKEMKKGDLAFFYHTGTQRQIMGIVEIDKEYYPDSTDMTGQFGRVDVRYKENFVTPVSLKWVKQQPDLQDILLVKHGRLSAMPITFQAWSIIYTKGMQKKS